MQKKKKQKKKKNCLLLQNENHALQKLTQSRYDVAMEALIATHKPAHLVWDCDVVRRIRRSHRIHPLLPIVAFFNGKESRPWLGDLQYNFNRGMHAADSSDFYPDVVHVKMEEP